MDWKTAVTVSVTVLIAGAGFVVKYLHDRSLARRKDRLDRVNRQLSELYGPLLALSAAGRSCWRAFRAKYRPGGKPFWGPQPPPTDQETAAYRLWMAEVFQPLNERMAEAVIAKADLLEGDDLPECLVDLCAHVAAHRTVLRQWEENDYSEHTLNLNFPQDVYPYVEKTFEVLKAEQSALLARSDSRPQQDR
jgi:hypothetical protein